MSGLELPEIADGLAWLKTSLAKRFSVYQRLSRALGADWAVSRTGTTGRGQDVLRPSEAAGLSLVHQPSSLAFRVVPGFSFFAGFASGELDVLRHVMAAAGAAPGSAHLPADGGEDVSVAPFLMCARPVRISEVGPLIRLDGAVALVDASGLAERVAFFRPEEALAALAPGPFALPTPNQWESAYRAGTQTPFPWGTDIPESLASIPPHSLDFTDLGVFPEGTATDRAYAARGGAVVHAPWTIADAGWAGLLAGLQAPWGPDAIATIRPVCPLPA